MDLCALLALNLFGCSNKFIRNHQRKKTEKMKLRLLTIIDKIGFISIPFYECSCCWVPSKQWDAYKASVLPYLFSNSYILKELDVVDNTIQMGN